MDTNIFETLDIKAYENLDQKTGNNYFQFIKGNKEFFTNLQYDPFEFDDAFWVRVSNQITTLLYNKIKFENKIYENQEDLINFISTNFPKFSPLEKLDNVLEYIHSKTVFDGEVIKFDFKDELKNNEIWRKLYFFNADEFEFYFDNLRNQRFLKVENETAEGNADVSVTIAGLTTIIKIQERKNSRFCFIAMSFSADLISIYESGILPALNETGFLPFIVSLEHISSEVTINDAIIAGIKKSKFTIADFTEHKAGVYFEAGYALGRNQKVIYTCRKDDIINAHFDTRNYQHIVWETYEELRLKLVDKINAYIIE